MKVINRITEFLATAGTVTHKVTNLRVGREDAASILTKYPPFKNKGVSFVRNQLNAHTIIKQGAHMITVELSPNANALTVAAELMQTAQSIHHTSVMEKSFLDERLTIDIHLSAAALADGLNPATAVRDALLFEDLHDNKISTSEKLGLVYQKITVQFI